MFGSFYKRGEFAWVQDVRGNYLCIHEGELKATVFSTEWQPWQVIFNHPEVPALLQGVRFNDIFAAMSRADEILSGAARMTSLIGLPHFWQPAR